MRPSLLRAVAAGRVDIEAVGLGKRARDAGFDLRRKARQNGQRGSEARGNG